MSFHARAQPDLPTHSIGPSEVAANGATLSPTALEFFAGSGLVSLALTRFFSVVSANDICQKKAAVYRANHKHHTLVHEQKGLGSISQHNTAKPKHPSAFPAISAPNPAPILDFHGIHVPNE